MKYEPGMIVLSTHFLDPKPTLLLIGIEADAIERSGGSVFCHYLTPEIAEREGRPATYYDPAFFGQRLDDQPIEI